MINFFLSSRRPVLTHCDRFYSVVNITYGEWVKTASPHFCVLYSGWRNLNLADYGRVSDIKHYPKPFTKSCTTIEWKNDDRCWLSWNLNRKLGGNRYASSWREIQTNQYFHFVTKIRIWSQLLCSKAVHRFVLRCKLYCFDSMVFF